MSDETSYAGILRYANLPPSAPMTDDVERDLRTARLSLNITERNMALARLASTIEALQVRVAAAEFVVEERIAEVQALTAERDEARARVIELEGERDYWERTYNNLAMDVECLICGGPHAQHPASAPTPEEQ